MPNTTESETDDKPEVEKTEGTEEQTEGTTAPKTLAEALALIEKLGTGLKESNAEAAKRRKALKKFEDAEAARAVEEKKREDAKLGEAEKLKQEKSEMELRLTKQEADFKAERIKSAVERQAAKMDFHNEEQAYKLADLSEVDIEDGKVVGVEAALKALAKASPHLVKAKIAETEIDATRKSTDKTAKTPEEKAELAAIYGVKPEFVK